MHGDGAGPRMRNARGPGEDPGVVTDMGAAPTESVQDFIVRVRRWLADNMPRLDPDHPPRAGRHDEGAWQRARELQKRLHGGGFAGICFPREYGGLGLDAAYQQAFTAETAGYEMPVILNVPTFAICCASLLDTGTEAQKRQHIAAALRESPGVYPEGVAWGVFKVLERRISAGEIGDVKSILPAEVRALWPESEVRHGS